MYNTSTTNPRPVSPELQPTFLDIISKSSSDESIFFFFGLLTKVSESESKSMTFFLVALGLVALGFGAAFGFGAALDLGAAFGFIGLSSGISGRIFFQIRKKYYLKKSI